LFRFGGLSRNVAEARVELGDPANREIVVTMRTLSSAVSDIKVLPVSRLPFPVKLSHVLFLVTLISYSGLFNTFLVRAQLKRKLRLSKPY
jgi:hypothetical protein